MQTESTAQLSFTRRLLARESWIGPVCGFISAVTVSLIGRALHLEYRREIASAVFFLVLVLVGTYYNGKLKKHPFKFVAWAIVSALVGVAITRWNV